MLLKHSWDAPLGPFGSENSHHMRTPSLSASWLGFVSSIEPSARGGGVLKLRTTASQKCAAVPKRDRIEGS